MEPKFDCIQDFYFNRAQLIANTMLSNFYFILLRYFVDLICFAYASYSILYTAFSWYYIDFNYWGFFGIPLIFGYFKSINTGINYPLNQFYFLVINYLVLIITVSSKYNYYSIYLYFSNHFENLLKIYFYKK